MTRIIDTLSDISDNYDAVFCDLWGCLHDGITPFDSAVEALRSFKAGGGTVLLLTNSPRTRASVAKQLDRIGVPRDCWDVIATSGDSARAAMLRGAVGTKVWHIGQSQDESFFAPMEMVDDAVDIARVPLKEAEGIVCTGPFDPHADPADLRPQFLLAKSRGLKLLCANPDIVVDRGDERIWCAGALAQLYTEMGGESLYFGKPHPPIYDLARRRLVQIGKPASDDRILAIGDGINTDVSGGTGENIDTLFITGGLARGETGTEHQPNETKLASFLTSAQLEPTFAIGMLR
ncbi:TIGR01459 family HAD-type hydrolase [Gymnodinialimonas ceratoperidinii]|uniref:TIGR01459 family HAD-type hydrolase n=1 Tax=Gymnodinialimonas ceratoperidinii TaxID=2856823 RepID=A0A8F6TY17_9RHOB|nr:TIGR01459 family HAD-type hydrolase [Gymnodinialimonas ceratoperidinii]QXT40760.1 TIGR01459 family HAD-type hydrolase [Gymnodinialimonas ceratoperidinii]